MRVLREVRVSALAVVFALLLVGCTPQKPAASPEPSPTSTPVFASDADALAAATKAYAAYLKMSDSVAHDSGNGVERLKRYTTGSAYANELKVFESFRSKGLTGIGQSRFDSISLESYDSSTGDIVVYLCVDLSKTDIVDRNRTSTVSEDRPNRFPFEVTLAPTTPGSNNLWITKSESWTGTNFC